MRSPVFSLVAGLFLALNLMSSALAGIEPPGGRRLPDLDTRKAQALNAEHENQGLAHLLEIQPGVKVNFDPIIGSPRSISAPQGFLSGTNGSGKAISPKTAQRFSKADRNAPTKAFLAEHAALFGNGAEILNNARVKRDFVTAHNGMHSMVWEQQIDGIGIFEAVLSSHTTQKGELVTVSSRFLPNPLAARDLGTPDSAQLIQNPPVQAVQALIAAAQNVGESLEEAQVTLVSGPTNTDAEQKHCFNAPTLSGEAYASLIWLPMDQKRLRLCWRVIFMSAARHEAFQTLVDVQTGEIYIRRNQTVHLSQATYRVFTGDSPSPLTPGLSVPGTNQPPLVLRSLVTLSALNTNASPNGWLDDGADVTSGNNVDAHLDWDANDWPDTPLTYGTSYRIFDYPLDLMDDPWYYADASVVQLFYWCNWAHDKLYELGFDEAAGNFQNENFGRGGIGGDAVQADAQDGSTYDNSTFSTLPDGYAPRMEMFLFSGPTPMRDASLDAEVILHEYVHGLSNRRVGGGIGLYTQQSMGMGEGWSDFYALSLLSSPQDDVDANYPIGGYSSYMLPYYSISNNTFVTHYLTENYYYGIRRYPYTTDLLKNPLTFKDIDPGQADSHAGIPINPSIAAYVISPDEVHNQGEVWCSILWEARAAMIRKYGGTTGNKRMLQLVTDAMNLTPPNPNFIEARDAILMADLVNNGGADRSLLWTAFAKRGLGRYATSPSSATCLGVVESFTSQEDLMVSSETCISKGAAGGPFSLNAQEWDLSYEGSASISWTASTSAPWLSLFTSSGTLSGSNNSVTVMAFLNPKAMQLSAGLYTNSIFFTNPETGSSQTRYFILSVGQREDYAQLFYRDTNDLAYQSFLFTPDGSSNYYSVCRSVISALPTDPTGGTELALTDDSSFGVRFLDSKEFNFFGVRRKVAYIGSNGYITFGKGDVYNEQSYDNHFSLARISALLDDFNPEWGGSVSWKQLADRFVVTWLDVTEYYAENSSTFQIELFFDGRIRVSYLQMEAAHGVAGLSRGGAFPQNFLPTDFSLFSLCEAIPSSLSVNNASITEGAKGTSSTADFSISLSSANATPVTVLCYTEDGSATAGLDYVALPTRALVFPPGETNKTVSVTILGDGVRESDEVFYLNVVGLTNAASGPLLASGMIVNDDGFSGALDHLVWSPIGNAQEPGKPFQVKLSALDFDGLPATNSFSIRVTDITPKLTNFMLGNAAPAGTSSSGTYTFGYSFTPTNDLTVTHWRHFGGKKLSIWKEDGTLLLSQNVVSKPGYWVETPLATPLLLSAGCRYRIGVYTGGEAYSWVASTTTFAAGSINRAYYSTLDEFPTLTANRIPMVDLQYFEGWPLRFSPSTVLCFTNGVWSGPMVVETAAQNVRFMADDGLGHSGLSDVFDVLPRIGLVMADGKVVLSWSVTNCVLETSDSLSPAIWKPVTNGTATFDRVMSVTNSPGTGTRFYRLRQ